MPRNGSGSYSLPQAAFVPSTTISSAAVNSDYSDIATALTGSVCVDGQTTITGQLKHPNGSASAPSITFGPDLTTGLFLNGNKQLGLSAGGTLGAVLNLNNQGVGQNGNLFYLNTPTGAAYLCPVGTIIDFAGTVPPAGWFICVGQNAPRASYPELFNVISTTYGSGDGSTTFGIPDCRGRATYSIDSSGSNRITVAGGNIDGTVQGNSGGAQNQTLSQAQLPVFSQTPTFSGGSVTPTFTGSGQAWGLNQNNIPFNANTSAGPSAGSGVSTAYSVGAISTVTITPAGSISSVTAAGTISAVTFGSGSSHPILGPAIMTLKIIFGGRQ
jgi:microcystin-dependent protein